MGEELHGVARRAEREEEREAEQGRSRLERRVGGELQVEYDQAEDVVGKAASPDLGLGSGLGLGLGQGFSSSLVFVATS